MQSVFVVDDDSDDLLFVKNAFEKVHNRIFLQTFPNGMELLKQLKSPSPLPSFILMDLNMPIISGIETLRVIRNTENLAHLNVIIFSTSNNPDEIRESLNAGASEFISKPFTANAYEAIAGELCRKWVNSESVLK